MIAAQPTTFNVGQLHILEMLSLLSPMIPTSKSLTK